jgi:cellulose synthase/poly-beta-1,6-N-acetylglucosamine synthase-like glycosyltransferase
MTDPLVSVIVPAYNAASTVQETLRSVLTQTVAEIEVIVVDDGSTDDTAMAVDNVAAHDPRVRLERQPQCGVAAARNRAIRCASGEFIAPMDADDLWHPTKLERQLERFQGGEPDLGLVYSWFRYMDISSVVLGDGPRPTFEGSVLDQHLQWNFLGNGSIPLIRAKALFGLGYEPSLQRQGAEGCEDFLLQLQLSRHWRFGCAPGFLIGYRRSPDAMSANWVRMQRSFAAMYQILETELSGSARTLCRRKRVEYLVGLSRNRATAGRFGEAARFLSEAFNTDTAHGLRRLAAECGGLPQLVRRKIRPELTPSLSTAFLDLDPADVTRAAYPEWAA